MKCKHMIEEKLHLTPLRVLSGCGARLRGVFVLGNAINTKK